MDKLLYVAMTGAAGALQQQASNNHNLANINTTGFKADLEASMAIELPQPLPTRVFTDVNSSGFDRTPGELKFTGRELDVAISGEGYIAVLGTDGETAYTRNGNLRVAPSGMLENAAGHAVLGNQGPIMLPPYESINIAADGSINFKPAGGGAESVQLDRIRLVSDPEAKLEKLSDGTFRPPPELIRRTRLGGDGATNNVSLQEQIPELDEDPNVNIVRGALEGSNVNITDTMVKMIELARLYEMQVKLMRTAEENDTATTRLVNG